MEMADTLEPEKKRDPSRLKKEEMAKKVRNELNKEVTGVMGRMERMMKLTFEGY